MSITYTYDDHVAAAEFFMLLDKLSAAEDGNERFPARDVFHKSLRDANKETHSLKHCISITARSEDHTLLGYLRIITDRTYIYYILDVMVDPHFQRQGIGTHLARLAIESGQAHGFIKIFLTAIPGLEQFYAKLGFRPGLSSVLVLRGEEHSSQ